jgi:replicative DNA helicase
MAKDLLAEALRNASFVDNDASINRDYDPWILEPLVTFQSVSIIDGLGGSGKSWFSIDLCYAISLGQPFLGMFPVKRQGPIMYLTAEEVPEVFVKRLDAIKKHYPIANKNFIWTSMLHENIDVNPSLCVYYGSSMIPSPFFNALEQRIIEVQPVLVVLDSLINFFGLDENSSKEARYFMELLRRLTRRHKTSFLLLHHQNKEGMRTQSDDVVSFRGSGVFREQARARIIYKNVKLEEGVFAKKIIIEKSNYYSRLMEILPELYEGGLYLKFAGGKHEYDRDFAEQAKVKEEEAKQKGKKKGSNKSNGRSTSTRADL